MSAAFLIWMLSLLICAQNGQESLTQSSNLQPSVTLFHIILGSTTAVLVFIIAISYIDATRCRINDFYRLNSLIHAAMHILDMLSDILFTAHLSFHPRWETNASSPLFMMFVASCLFIIIPILITLAQLNREINKHWMKNDQLRLWISEYVKILYCFSILLGSSFASVDLCCSNLFQMNIFSIPITKKRLIGFQNKIYSLVLCENVPQLALQILYVYNYQQTNTWTDEVVYIAMAFSVISIIAALFSWKSRKNLLVSQNYVSIQFKVKGHAVCSNISKCKKRIKEIKEYLSGILGVENSLIEITKPEQTPGGLLIKTNLFVNYVRAVDTNWKTILNNAVHNGQLGLKFKESWNLSTSPLITNIKCKINERKNRVTVDIKVMSKKHRNNHQVMPQNMTRLIPIIKHDYGTSSETKQDTESDSDSLQETTQTTLDQNIINCQQNSLLYEKNWKLLMDAIEQNCPLAEQYEVFKAMRQVALNVLIDDEKYRILYADNIRVQQRILGHVGGYEFLRAVGFQKGVNDNQLICKLPNTKIIQMAIKVLNKKIKCLKKIKHQWQQNAEPNKC